MISSILYEGKLKEKQNNYFYSEEYVEFLVTRYLFIKRQARVEDVYEFIIKYIDSDLVKMSGLKRFLKENYENVKTMYYLNQSQKENIANTLDMKKDLDFIMNVYQKERKINGYIKQLQWDMAIGLQQVDNLKISKHLESIKEKTS